MKRLENTFKNKENILNIYVTAGYPKLNDTVTIVQELEKSGADIIEIGMPFSDPLADGPTIQNSSQIAINNGITLDLIFDQIVEIRKTVTLPIILMGYYNQVMQYGDVAFFEKAKAVGVDGFILPDLPINTYKEQYKALLQDLALDIIFLITPQTTEERIQLVDHESSGFLYVVSSYSITGSNSNIQQNQIDYFKKINQLVLKNPTLIGFGISEQQTFNTACQYADGAIIGSAFIKALAKSTNINKTVSEFVSSVIGE